MTVLEALNLAMETLNGISVPVPQLQTIGLPIGRANDLIRASVDALEKNSPEQKQEETPEDKGGEA